MGSPASYRIADLRLEALVGTGSYAEVWRVRDRSGKVAALKRMLPHVARNASAVAAFEREASLLARVDCPSIPRLLASDTDETGPYLLLEYVDGPSLANLLGKPVPPAIALRVAHDLISALEVVHELRADDGARLGLVHRDLSPGNVLISQQGAVKLSDFGIARAHAGTLATTGIAAKGTLGYMSPEQARGEPLDGRSDLFSVGALLHELVCGAPPYDESDPRLALARARAGDVRAFSSTLPDASAALADLIDRALSARAADRFPSAAAMRAEVLLCAEQAGGLAPDEALGAWAKTAPRQEMPADEITAVAASTRRDRRSSGMLIGLVVAGLLAMAGGYGLWRTLAKPADGLASPVPQPSAQTVPVEVPSVQAPASVGPSAPAAPSSQDLPKPRVAAARSADAAPASAILHSAKG